MEVIELRVADKFVGSAVLEHLRMLNATTDLWCHPLHFLIVVRLSKEILAGVDELVAECIRFDLSLKQILGSTGRIVQNGLDLAHLRPLAPFNVVIITNFY